MSFDISGMKAQDMKIKLESILPSLAKNLYGDDWRISIRELLQNCHDSFVATGVNESLGEIRIIPDRGNGTLTFKDNGVGMNLDEVTEYLATVGAGYKREQLENLSKGHGDRETLNRIIGQYGIGFLSAFIIANKVQVKTKSISAKNSPGVRCIFTGQTKWYATEDESIETGTEIILQLKKETLTDPDTGEKVSIQDLLNFENLSKEVRRFGDLLPFPIFVHRSPDDRNGEICNSTKWPWDNKKSCSQADLIEFLKKRHPQANEPIYATNFSLTEKEHGVKASGFIYFPRESRVSNRMFILSGEVELFCRRMFITDKLSALLPDWARFTGVVVECPGLSPTLNRNDVIRHDLAFIALKQGLKSTLTEKLKWLAEKQPTTFYEILSEYSHEFSVALMADYQESPDEGEEFFRTIIEYIPFTVVSRQNPGGAHMTLPEYLTEFGKRNPNPQTESDRLPIYYLSNQVSAAQYQAMIIQRDIPVVWASRETDIHLIRAYGEVFSDKVILTDVTQMLDLYVEVVDQTPYAIMKEFLSGLNGGGPDEVKAARFEPSYVPAIMIATAATDPEGAAMLEKFLSEAGNVLSPKIKKTMHDEMESAKLGKMFRTVILNDNNQLIRTVKNHCAEVNQGGERKPLTSAMTDVIREIYHLARTYSNPGEGDNERFFEHRNNMLMDYLKTEEKLRLEEAKSDRLKMQIVKSQTNIPKTDVPELMESRMCALLLTDLIGSTRMVGFLDSEDSSAILQEYANEIQKIVMEHNGKVEKFTGDGIFAHFGLDDAQIENSVQNARDCAFKIKGFTSRFFDQKEVRKKLTGVAQIRINSSRTVLHAGKVMYGLVNDIPTLVGKQIVVLFRACDRKDLFKDYPIIMTHSFYDLLNLKAKLNPFEEDLRLDPDLPQITFYPHPEFARDNAKENRKKSENNQAKDGT